MTWRWPSKEERWNWFEFAVLLIAVSPVLPVVGCAWLWLWHTKRQRDREGLPEMTYAEEQREMESGMLFGAAIVFVIVLTCARR